MALSNNELEIKYVIEILNSILQGYTYSILEIDAPMPGHTKPTWREIDTTIRTKTEGYLLDSTKLKKITGAFSDIYDFVIVADENIKKLKSSASISKDQFEFMDKAFFSLIIEDGQIYEIRCEDRHIENKIKGKLGPLPRFVSANRAEV